MTPTNVLEQVHDLLQVLPYMQTELHDEIASRQRRSQLRALRGQMDGDWLYEQMDAEAIGRQSVIGGPLTSYAGHLARQVLASRMTCPEALASINVQRVNAREACRAIMAGDTDGRKNIGWYRGRLNMLEWLEGMFVPPVAGTQMDDASGSRAAEAVLEGVG